MSQINSKNTKPELAAALLALTREEEFGDISVSSVAFKANMHRNTVYYHFNDMRDLCLWSVHYYMTGAIDNSNYQTLRDSTASFFSRYRRLLEFTKREIGVDSYLDRMRLELLGYIEPHTTGNSEEEKKTNTDFFIEQILVASLLHNNPENIIKKIFDK